MKKFIFISLLFFFTFLVFAQNAVSNNYSNTNEYYKNILVANKAGFKNYDEYKDFLNRIDFENFYKSVNLGKDTNYIPGDIIEVPSQRLSIVDVDTSEGGFLYLITGYSQNQLSKCCMVISPYQIQHVDSNGEGLIIEKLFLEYQGKSTYKQRFTIYECDVFKVLNSSDPVVEELRNKLYNASKIQKKNFNNLLENLSAEEYQILLNNNFISTFNSNSIQKIYYSCTSQIIDTENKRSAIDYYDSWKRVFENIINSTYNLSDKDYYWLCSAFTISDEFNELFEKCIDKTNFSPKWFFDSYGSKSMKNLHTILNHIPNIKPYTSDIIDLLILYGVTDEQLIKQLLQNGLDCSIINSYDFDVFTYIGNLPPNILQLYIDNGLDINMRIPLIENYTLLKALKYVYNDEEEWGSEHTVRKDIIDCLIRNGAKE